MRVSLCVQVCAHLFYCLISLCLLITLPALHSHLNVSNSLVFQGDITAAVLQYTGCLALWYAASKARRVIFLNQFLI